MSDPPSLPPLLHLPINNGDTSGARKKQRASVVSQEQAAKWFEVGTVLGEGAYGEARTCKVEEEWKHALGPVVVVKKMHEEDDANEFDLMMTRAVAVREHAAHDKAWKRMPLECKRYLAEPAEMTFGIRDASGNFTSGDPKNGSYLVQSLVGLPGLTTMSFDEFNGLVHAATAMGNPGIDRSSKEKLARDFGDMLGCITNTRMVHNDINWLNLLVLTNWRPHTNSASSDGVQIELRLIDWGGGKAVGDANDALDEEMCHESGSWDDVPGFRFAAGDDRDSYCHHERKGLVEEFCKLLAGDGVMDVDVADWIREAFAAKTGLRIPQTVKDKVAERRRTHQNGTQRGADAL